MNTPTFKKEAIEQPETCNGADFDPDEKSLTRQKTERYGQDTRHRSRLIYWVMIIIPAWLIAVLCIVAFTDRCMVSDTVKTTLLVTTTANVIGLALVVLKGMFKAEE